MGKSHKRRGLARKRGLQMDKDAVFFVCSLIESIGRKSKNHRAVVVQALGEEGIERQLKLADVQHCLPLEQVTGEVMEQYGIPEGTFDTVSTCKYKVPSVTAIGKTYARIVAGEAGEENVAKIIQEVFASFLSDAISNFNAATYYQNPSYLTECYRAGTLLD